MYRVPVWIAALTLALVATGLVGISSAHADTASNSRFTYRSDDNGSYYGNVSCTITYPGNVVEAYGSNYTIDAIYDYSLVGYTGSGSNTITLAYSVDWGGSEGNYSSVPTYLYGDNGSFVPIEDSAESAIHYTVSVPLYYTNYDAWLSCVDPIVGEVTSGSGTVLGNI